MSSLENFKGNEGIEPLEKFDSFTKKRAENLAKDAKDLEKELDGNLTIGEIRKEIEEGRFESPAKLTDLERQMKELTLNIAKGILEETTHESEDNKLGFTANCLSYMRGLSTKDLANEIKGLKKCAPEQLKHKQRLERLKKTSPKAFNLYLAETFREQQRGTLQRSKTEILEEIETSYKKAIKAHPTVQNTFFQMVESGKINSGNCNEELAILEKRHSELLKRYESLLDPEIFGDKPRKEFLKWIETENLRGPQYKGVEGVAKALRDLENELIPKRRRIQKDFSKLPETIREPYEKTWRKELGCSERESLLTELQKLEHSKESNPLAKNYLKLLTDNLTEIAPKEYHQLMSKFAARSYKEQELLLAAFEITELEDRHELTKAFKKLPKEIRESQAGIYFFTLNKSEKIVTLDVLSKEAEEGTDIHDWTKMIASTEKAQKVYSQQLARILSGSEGEEIVLIDALAGETLRSEQKTGETQARNRQESAIQTIEGESAAMKAREIHELSQGERTLDAIDTDEETEFTTIDLKDITGSGLRVMEEQDRRRLLSQAKRKKLRTNSEEHMAEIRFTNHGREVPIQKNESLRSAIDEMVMEKVTQALEQTIEILRGKPLQEGLSDTLSRDESTPLINLYRKDIQRRFGSDVESLTVKKHKAA